MKKFVVRFQRQFVKGTLTGLCIDAQLGFATREAANEYFEFLVAHEKKPVEAYGGADYLCLNPAIHAYGEAGAA